MTYFQGTKADFLGNNLTHLIYAGAAALDADGSYNGSAFTAKLAIVEPVLHSRGVKLTITAPSLTPVVQDANKRATFVSSLLQFCQTNKVDGMSFDWETITQTEVPFFTTLIAQLRAAAPPGFVISAYLSDGGFERLQSSAAQYLDWIDVGTYDGTGPNGAMTLAKAATDLNTAVNSYGFPKEKILMGLSIHENTYSLVQDKTNWVYDNGFGGMQGFTLEADAFDSTSRFLSAAVTARAATFANAKFWSGGGDGTWADTSNWLAGSAPASTNDVCFGQDATSQFDTVLGSNLTVKSLMVYDVPAPVTITGSSLTLSSGIDMNYSYQDLTINSPVNLGASQTWSVGYPRVATVNGTLAGSGFGLTKAGSGTVALGGTNTYTGVTTITGGFLKVTTIGDGGVAGSLGQASNAAANLVLSSGTLQYAGVTASTNRSFTLTAAMDSSISVTEPTTNLTISGASTATTGSLNKTGPGTLTLSGLNLHTGGTDINGGTLAIGATNTLKTTAAVAMNSTGGSTTPGTLDLSGFSQTIASLAVMNTATSSANADAVVIGSGKVLTVNGGVTIGSPINGATTFARFSGAGTLAVSNSSGTFQVGGGSATIANAATLDMSSLSTFTAALGTTGTFRVGDNGAGIAGNTSGASTAILAKTSTITANKLDLGGASTGTATQTLKLGSTSSTINVNNVRLGAEANASSRSSAEISFQSSTGTLTMRGAAGGVTRVSPFDVINDDNSTSASWTGKVDLSGHSADLMIGTLTIGKRTATGGTQGSATGTFIFGTGTLDVTSIDMANHAFSGTAANPCNASGTLTIGGGTATIGSITAATYTTGSGTAGGSANATLNFTGGTITMGGNISKGTANAAATTTLTLNGASLNMAGHNIGGSASIDSLNFQSGTLMNVAQINNGAGLTKSTNGTLILSGTNTYTGPTTVNAGTLRINGSTGSGAVTVASGATLGGTGSIGGPVTVHGTLAPGNSTGTLTAASANLGTDGNLQIEINDASTPKNDQVAVAGALNIAGTTLTFNVTGTPTAAAYIVASYGSRIGTFGTVYNLPAGYSLNYSYNDGVSSNHIALVHTGADAYTGWLSVYPAITGVDQAPDADFDHDGLSNGVEFVLGTDPTGGTAARPVFATSAGNLQFTFKRSKSSKGLAVYVQTSTSLQTWEDTVLVPTVATAGPPVSVVDNGDLPDDVMVTLPMTADPKKFVRLRVAVPSSP